MATTVLLFVSPTKNSIELCKYLLKNKDHLRDMNVKLKVTKLPREVDESMAAKLKKAKITHLPAAVVDNKVIIGVDKICKLFEKNINKMLGNAIPKPEEFGSNPDLADYWREQMMADPRDPHSQEDPEADKNDMMKQLSRAEGRRKQTMSHRVGNVPPEEEEPAQDMRGRQQNNTREPSHRPIDNIGNFKTGNSEDDQMFGAFADKMGISSFN